jgi:hypothetical protein
MWCRGGTGRRLVVTKKGWTESNEGGDFIEQGEWPRESKRAVRFALNNNFELSFADRQNITITYTVRTPLHLTRVLPYSDEKVANRSGRVWHGTANGWS